MRRGASEESGEKVGDERKAERDSVRLAGADQLVPVPFYERWGTSTSQCLRCVCDVHEVYNCVGDLQETGLFCN